VIAGNGCRLPEFARRLSLPGEVTTVDVEENLGCPGGRNVALSRLREFGDVDVVVELDDDGLLVDAGVLRRVRDLYAAEPGLGIVGFRIADEHGGTRQRHVPRLGKSDPMRGGYVTGFLGGGHALRMAILEGVREPAGQRWPMRWRTVWRLTRLGRPPVIWAARGSVTAPRPDRRNGTEPRSFTSADRGPFVSPDPACGDTPPSYATYARAVGPDPMK
jgi:hypothetical protein